MHTATYQRPYSCRIWGYRSGDHENYRFQGRDTLKFGSDTSSETEETDTCLHIAKGYSFSTSKIDTFSVPQLRLFKIKISLLLLCTRKMFDVHASVHPKYVVCPKINGSDFPMYELAT